MILAPWDKWVTYFEFNKQNLSQLITILFVLYDTSLTEFYKHVSNFLFQINKHEYNKQIIDPIFYSTILPVKQKD